MERVPGLDGWRGLAIALVLVGHFAPMAGLNLGRLGVELFFVLSGRLMADVLFRERQPFGRFFARRIGRVVPALVAFVAVVGWVEAVPGRAVAEALTFTTNYASALGDRAPAFDHLWSLAVEEHTYLVLVGIAALTRRGWVSPGAACLALAGGAMVDGAICSALLHQRYVEVYWRTDVRMASILLGAGIRLAAPGPRSPAWFALGLIASLGFVPDPLKYSLGTLGFALAVQGVERWPILAWRPLRWLGLGSFSLYLWQQPLYLQVGRAPALVLLALAATCAGISWVAVEDPARRWVRAATTRREEFRQGAAIPAPAGPEGRRRRVPTSPSRSEGSEDRTK